ncbi:hypothetical protein B484DRAFT_457946, partial [Ochromonadaceae sp. CCMP2298]
MKAAFLVVLLACIATAQSFIRLTRSCSSSSYCSSNYLLLLGCLAEDDSEELEEKMEGGQGVQRGLEVQEIPPTTPTDLFLQELHQSLTDLSLLKFQLSENTHDTHTYNNFEGGEEEGRKEEEEQGGGLDWNRAVKAQMIAGRLVTKGKGKKALTKFQLTYFLSADKSQGSGTLTLDIPSIADDGGTSGEHLDMSGVSGWWGPMRKLFDTGVFKKAAFSTKAEDFELRMRKGGNGGKLKRTSKGHQHIDEDAILAEAIPTGIGGADSATIRRILEDRRVLLLSDPENRVYKALYAEAKQKAGL